MKLTINTLWVSLVMILAPTIDLISQNDVLFQVESNSQGILIPSMTEVQRNAIASPSTGLLMFQNNGTQGFYYYNGTEWLLLTDENALPDDMIFDSDGDTGIQVEESADEDIIRFDLGGIEYWRMNGPRLVPRNNGQSLFIGHDAGLNDDQGFNFNIFLGDRAGVANVGGNKNVAIGFESLMSNTAGNLNISIGHQSMLSNTMGSGNMAVGPFSLRNNTNGIKNTGLGCNTLMDNTTGNYNTGIGHDALLTNITGSRNTMLGFQADVLSGNLSNATAIGNMAKVGSSNSLILGGTGLNAVNVGISTTQPTNRLHVVGNIRMVDGNQASGKVLTSNANGVGSWQTLPVDPDEDPTNEIQDLTNVLGEGNDAGGSKITNLMDPSAAQDAATKNYVDTSDDVDDADNEPTNEIQDLADVLGEDNDAGGSKITNLMDPSAAQDAATKNYVDTNDDVDDADNDPTNELDNTDNQVLSLNMNSLELTSDDGTDMVDLSGYLDNTDNQELSLSVNSLELTSDDGTDMVDLSGYLDNTDDQTLSEVLMEGNSAGDTMITNLKDPVNAQDAATKNYVDNNDEGGTLQGTGVNTYNIRAREEGTVAGDARGEGSVDLQTQRDSAKHVASGILSTVLGGFSNTASGDTSSVAGGSGNLASGDRSFIGGGFENIASFRDATVAGGEENYATGSNSFIGGGEYNDASGSNSVVAGGDSNWADGTGAMVGGGTDNWAIEEDAAVVAGFGNTADNFGAFVGGGALNSSSGIASVVTGGLENLAFGDFSSILGGDGNIASGNFSATLGGVGLIAQSFGEGVAGTYNTPSLGDDDDFFPLEPIFVVGNGTSDLTRSNAMVILKNGDMGIGSNIPTEKLEVNGRIKLVDSSAPTAMGGFSMLYSDSGELYAYDGSGNSTQISPHNFSLRPASEPMAWSFYSKNAIKGLQVQVDMMKLARLMESVTGEKLVYLADLEGNHIVNEIEAGEIEKLKKENADIRRENDELKERLKRIEVLLGME